ncbi:hypothetical protein [Endozoicomonas sp. ONNA2]|nr:hypothetical protein [Endozoicomonas sp. ONNA2]
MKTIDYTTAITAPYYTASAVKAVHTSSDHGRWSPPPAINLFTCSA